MHRRLITAAAVLALAACAAPQRLGGPKGLQPGMDEAAVVGELGRLTDRYPRPDGGTRLVFARGPVGKETYLVDLGPDGRLTAWRQALTPEQFAAITPGMTAAQVLFDFGPPADKRPNRPTAGEIWSYRYPTLDCRWYRIEFNGIGRVVRSSYELEPSCASYL